MAAPRSADLFTNLVQSLLHSFGVKVLQDSYQSDPSAKEHQQRKTRQWLGQREKSYNAIK